MNQPNVDGVAAVAARSAQTLRQMASKLASVEAENVVLREKVASYERRDQVVELAREMETRGLSPELSLDEKVASISRYQDLSPVREAIKLAGGGRLDLPRVSDESATLSGRDASESSFANFCITGQSS